MSLNGGCVYEEVVRRGEGRTVLAYLAARYGHSSEAQWRDRLGLGLVTLDEAVASADARLRPGQRLAWHRPPWEEPEAPLAFAVLFEDEDLVAVAKPSGLPTLPGGGFLEHTLLHQVRRRHPEASPLHRLGRGTSGLVLFARHGEALAQISEAWRRHAVTKVYRALVAGHPAEEAFEITAPIGPVDHSRLGTVQAANPSGKAAHSAVRVLERRDGASLVEVAIATGRPHQIRIHMAACGHPLLGDPLYAAGGGLLGDGAALPGDLGYRLHAMRLRLVHPRTGATLDLTCRPPRPLRTAEGA